jgi:hypothetical protein
MKSHVSVKLLPSFDVPYLFGCRCEGADARRGQAALRDLTWRETIKAASIETDSEAQASGVGASKRSEDAPTAVAGIAASARFSPEFGREKATSELEDQRVIWGG